MIQLIGHILIVRRVQRLRNHLQSRPRLSLAIQIRAHQLQQFHQRMLAPFAIHRQRRVLTVEVGQQLLAGPLGGAPNILDDRQILLHIARLHVRRQALANLVRAGIHHLREAQIVAQMRLEAGQSLVLVRLQNGGATQHGHLPFDAGPFRPNAERVVFDVGSLDGLLGLAALVVQFGAVFVDDLLLFVGGFIVIDDDLMVQHGDGRRSLNPDVQHGVLDFLVVAGGSVGGFLRFGLGGAPFGEHTGGFVDGVFDLEWTGEWNEHNHLLSLHYDQCELKKLTAFRVLC